jgi:hypothetical protein
VRLGGSVGRQVAENLVARAARPPARRSRTARTRRARAQAEPHGSPPSSALPRHEARPTEVLFPEGARWGNYDALRSLATLDAAVDADDYSSGPWASADTGAHSHGNSPYEPLERSQHRSGSRGRTACRSSSGRDTARTGRSATPPRPPCRTGRARRYNGDSLRVEAFAAPRPTGGLRVQSGASTLCGRTTAGRASAGGENQIHF